MRTCDSRRAQGRRGGREEIDDRQAFSRLDDDDDGGGGRKRFLRRCKEASGREETLDGRMDFAFLQHGAMGSGQGRNLMRSTTATAVARSGKRPYIMNDWRAVAVSFRAIHLFYRL